MSVESISPIFDIKPDRTCVNSKHLREFHEYIVRFQVGENRTIIRTNGKIGDFWKIIVKEIDFYAKQEVIYANNKKFFDDDSSEDVDDLFSNLQKKIFVLEKMLNQFKRGTLK